MFRWAAGSVGRAAAGPKRLRVMESRPLPCLKSCLPTLLSSSSHPLSLIPHLDPRICTGVFSVWEMKRWRRAGVEEERERGRGREVDEEIESRISTAMCQPGPVGVYTRIQYH